MRRIMVYVTRDGVQHDIYGDARRHADEAFGAALTKLAREAVTITKFTHMLRFMEANIDRFTELAELQADMKIVELEDDDS